MNYLDHYNYITMSPEGPNMEMKVIQRMCMTHIFYRIIESRLLFIFIKLTPQICI